MTNPFDDIQRALWAAVLDYPPFVTEGNDAFVRPNNRLAVVEGIEGTLRHDKALQRAPGGDVPELLITQGGFLLTPEGPNSKTVGAQQTCIVQVLDKRKSVERLNAVRWAFYLACLHATLGKDKPFGLSFVNNWAITNTSEGRPLNPDNQQIGEWVVVLNVVLDLYWSKTELLGLPT